MILAEDALPAHRRRNRQPQLLREQLQLLVGPGSMHALTGEEHRATGLEQHVDSQLDVGRIGARAMPLHGLVGEVPGERRVSHIRR